MEQMDRLDRSRGFVFMHKGVWLVLAAVLCAPAVGRAENCAWLNAATAGGLLGGEASMKVTTTSGFDTTCEFTLTGKSAVSKLTIVVHSMAVTHEEFPAFLAQCGSDGTAMRAIGNEAVECMRASGENEVTEQVISRVRDRALVLTWVMPKPAGDAQAQSEIRDKFRNVAEQVAGSLF
jgi:hypothetical protein